MEKEPKNELTDKLNKREVQEFITKRKIQAGDLHLIEKLTSFPKNLIIAELHNMFNMYRDRSGKELENLIKTSGDQTKKLLYETALEFLAKYGWATSWNLVRILEEI